MTFKTSAIHIPHWILATTENVALLVLLYGAPEILNTDQGSQFTSEVFTKTVIEEAGVKLSMDGKGRAIDNVFIGRLWRSVKHEYIYHSPPADGLELYRGLKEWFDDYNLYRRHKSLKGDMPATVYKANKRVRPVAA